MALVREPWQVLLVLLLGRDGLVAEELLLLVHLGLQQVELLRLPLVEVRLPRELSH